MLSLNRKRLLSGFENKIAILEKNSIHNVTQPLMKRLFKILAIIFLLQIHTSYTVLSQNFETKGEQPQIAIDTQGTIRIVFGIDDKIMCVSSTDQGVTFSQPVTVGQIEDMHLGMSRGPQIASSAHYSMITAIDKKGTIHAFELDHSNHQWTEVEVVNDSPSSAPEGLMSIAADDQDNFYAVWLDTRFDKKNKIYIASTSRNTAQWSKNVMAYQSPDGTVCECCKPNIAVKGAKVYVMFRNWLNGSRDMYVMQSDKEKLSFTSPQKLGIGTWQLNGCPMDGGGVFIDDDHAIHTTWQREGKVFYSQPDKKEIQIGEGRASSISGKENPVIAWQEGTTLKVKYLRSDKEITIGKGSFIEVLALDDNKIICVWENDGNIITEKL